MINELSIPAKFSPFLGLYGEQLYDSYSGKVVCWGYKIVSRLGDSLFEELRTWAYSEGYSLECSYPTWFLITRKLTREEAVKLYGSVTYEEYGPRGGWKSVTFGETKFCSKHLKE